MKFGVVCLVIAAFIAISTAVAHLSCIYFGPACYAAQMAPPEIVASAEAGTWLAPIGTAIVSAIFVLLGCYALSAAKILPRLPLLNFGMNAIALACVIRGILPIQLWLRLPDRIDTAGLIAGVVWLATGLLFYFGFRAVKHDALEKSHQTH